MPKKPSVELPGSPTKIEGQKSLYEAFLVKFTASPQCKTLLASELGSATVPVSWDELLTMQYRASSSR